MDQESSLAIISYSNEATKLRKCVVISILVMWVFVSHVCQTVFVMRFASLNRYVNYLGFITFLVSRGILLKLLCDGNRFDLMVG